MTIRKMTANARPGLLRALDRAGFPHVGECTRASRGERGAGQRHDDGRVSAAGEAMR